MKIFFKTKQISFSLWFIWKEDWKSARKKKKKGNFTVCCLQATQTSVRYNPHLLHPAFLGYPNAFQQFPWQGWYFLWGHPALKKKIQWVKDRSFLWSKTRVGTLKLSSVFPNCKLESQLLLFKKQSLGVWTFDPSAAMFSKENFNKLLSTARNLLEMHSGGEHRQQCTLNSELILNEVQQQ